MASALREMPASSQRVGGPKGGIIPSRLGFAMQADAARGSLAQRKQDLGEESAVIKHPRSGMVFSACKRSDSYESETMRSVMAGDGRGFRGFNATQDSNIGEGSVGSAGRGYVAATAATAATIQLLSAGHVPHLGATTTDAAIAACFGFAVRHTASRRVRGCWAATGHMSRNDRARGRRLRRWADPRAVRVRFVCMCTCVCVCVCVYVHVCLYMCVSRAYAHARASMHVDICIRT